MAIDRALIDVQKDELRLRVQVEEVTFIVFNVIQHLHGSDNYFIIYLVEAIVSSQVGHTDPIETSLLHRDSVRLNDEDVAKYLIWMDSFEPNKRKYFEHLGESPNRLINSIEKSSNFREKPLLAHL